MTPRTQRPARPTIGWREYVALPDFGVTAIKAKVDTGARTSAIHAFNLERFTRDGIELARFIIHPRQRDAHESILVEAPVTDVREVRNTSGKPERRVVIRTDLELAGVRFPIELTLARRDAMGFRMLLGRAAVRKRFLIDPGRSFLAGRPAEPIG